MDHLRFTTIIPVAVYCFFLALISLCFSIHFILVNQAALSSDTFSIWWLPVAAFFVISGGLVAVGIGILNVNNLSWKVLFFLLAISVACIISLTVDSLVFLFLNSNDVYSFLQVSRINPFIWFCLVFFFLSEIIILFHLSREEVVTYFGGLGDMLSPF